MTWRVEHGDCLVLMRELGEASVDAIVCDPPYGLEFMGKAWDSFGRDTSNGYRETPRITDREAVGGSVGAYMGAGGHGVNHFQAGRPFQAWCEAWAREALRVLKPGGHLLAFGGTRTYHRLACGIEDAGFEVRDCIAWLYGSGFPKSLNVSKAIDNSARGDLTRCRIAAVMRHRGFGTDFHAFDKALGLPATGGGGLRDWIVGGHAPSDATWQRIRSSLDITAEDEAAIEREAVRRVHRKNGRDATSIRLGFSSDEYDETAPATPEAERWQGWGTALKPAHEPIIVARKPLCGTVAANVLAHGTGALNIDGTRIGSDTSRGDRYNGKPPGGGDGEILPGPKQGEPWNAAAGRWPANVILDDEAAAMLDEQTGTLTTNPGTMRTRAKAGEGWGSVGERQPGAVLSCGDSGGASRFFYCAKASRRERNAGLDADARNAHPTVKPVDVMRWLCRLVTPPNGIILDPFTGSGTTGIAALLEDFRFLGIEQDAEYVPIARARIAWFAEHGSAALEQVRMLERSDAERDERKAAGQLDLLGT